MPWARVDDRFADHPKVNRLLEHGIDGYAALGVWVLMNARVTQQLSDGWISAMALARTAPNAEPYVQLLIDVGLVDRSQDGYKLHDYTDWNDDRETVLSKRKATRERQRRWRDTRRDTNASPNGATNGAHTTPHHLLKEPGSRVTNASIRILPGWPAELADTALRWASYDAPDADDHELRQRCEQRFGHMLPNAQDPSE